MANITYLSNQAGFPVDDNPGGDTPTGTVEWHDSLYYNYYNWWTSAAKTELSYSQIGFNQLLNSNRLVFNRDFSFYVYTWAQRAYDVCNLDAGLISSQSLAIVAPWTMDQPYTTAWNHGGHDKLIYTASRTNGSNKAQILAVDVDTGLYFSSMTPTQIGAITGATAYEVYQHPSLHVVASPDGTKLFTGMATKLAGYLHQRFYQIDQNSGGEFTGLTLMSGVAAGSFGQNSLIGCTNNRVLMVKDNSGFAAQDVTIRDAADLSLVTTVTLSGGLKFFGTNRAMCGTITKGNFIYFPSFVGTSFEAASVIGLQLIKLNMTTGSVVGIWDISNPPIESGFTPSGGEVTAEPGNQMLDGMAFTPGGTL